MADNRSYIVRPPPKAPRTDLKDAFWIYLSPGNLLLHGLRPGEICQLQNSQGVSRLAIARDNAKIQDSVVQVSPTIQAIYGFKLGDKISVQASKDPVTTVGSVTLEETVNPNVKETIAVEDRPHWAWIAEDALRQAEYLCPGMVFEVEARRQKKPLVVTSINGWSSNAAICRFIPDSIVKVDVEATESQSEVSSPYEHGSLEILNDHIAGLDRQMMEINHRLNAYNISLLGKVEFPTDLPPRPGGILIHGPSGTGKTLILDHVTKVGGSRAFRVEITTSKGQAENEKNLRQTFAEARRHQPSVIVIDRLEDICGKLLTQTSLPSVNMMSVLRAELDASSDARTLVIAATRSLSNIDDDLRSPGCFRIELETTVPDSKARIEILKIISGLSKDAESPELHHIGERTHGYVGADLLRLYRRALDKAENRISDLRSSNATTKTNGVAKVEMKTTVTENDINAALLEIRPMTMREVFLETPNVRWSDIGGQEGVKDSLQKAIEWPLKYPDLMKCTGQDQKTGLLLYGPPGCSKTLIAKALATEADFNFIAVRGPELLSMYVGESERAVREVFRKARNASPSIIFFDEIDALGASRDTNHAGLHVVTALLSELDGIENLKGVVVLAATNNPAILDPALIRAGRFSTHFYIGLPDLDTRIKILHIRLQKVNHTDDINVPQLASAMEGFSGSEIVDICQKAGAAAMDSCLESGEKPAEPHVTMEQLMKAIEFTEKGVTAEQLQAYEAWRASRR